MVHPRVDGWLVGGLGIVAWVAVTATGATGQITGAFAAVLLVVASMHFGASYHLAYGGGRAALRRHPLAFIVVPLVLLAATGLVAVVHTSGHVEVASQMVRILFIVVFTLTGWHYIKQAFGVALLAGGARGLKPTRREALILRFSLYPVWLFSIMNIYAAGRGASYRGLDVSVGILPDVTAGLLGAVALLALGTAALVMVRMGSRARAVPPLGMWGAYATGGLWLMVPPTFVSTAVVLAGLHGIQYLTCAHRAEMDWAVERGEKDLTSWWLCAFGGAAAGGLLVGTWLPGLVDGSVTTTGLPGLYGSMLFVMLNLHHYAIDAVIWRSSEEHVMRIRRGPATAPAAANATGVEVAAPAEPVAVMA